MEKVYTAREFKMVFPEVWEKLNKAFSLAMEATIKPIAEVLKSENEGTVLLHSAFVRILDDTLNVNLYIEIHRAFTKFSFGIQPTILKIISYPSLSAYEEARKNLEKSSRERFGNYTIPPPMRFEDL